MEIQFFLVLFLQESYKNINCIINSTLEFPFRKWNNTITARPIYGTFVNMFSKLNASNKFWKYIY